MASVLTTASRVACPHGGAVSTSGQSRLRVLDAPVLRQDGVAGRALDSNCAVVTDPNTSTLKCATVAAVTAGQATKLKVGGAAVLLDTLAGTTNGTPPPTGATLSATAGQAKLRAV